jgi:hypothetical protein
MQPKSGNADKKRDTMIKQHITAIKRVEISNCPKENGLPGNEQAVYL